MYCEAEINVYKKKNEEAVLKICFQLGHLEHTHSLRPQQFFSVR